jgi:mannose-6-phosphate isomerase-like protein (cupin superfamily)
MGYHTVDLDTIDPHPKHECDRRTLQEAVHLDHVGLSVYTAEPGEEIPQRYHYHDTQEELFYVVEGQLHAETPEKKYVVEENGVFVAEPNSPHRVFNPGSAVDTLRVVAVGGPNLNDDGHKYTP